MSKFKPHIGKNVIETLTLGMYEDPRFIYREYVQNAADQIDVAVEEGILQNKAEGEINITINQEDEIISVEDNATGIRSKDVLKFLGDVANSQKDRTKRKGFRGIGRLGGLGYCEKLIFETSYEGEDVKSIITLNAEQLRKIIADKADTSDAATVISIITDFDKQSEVKNKHYFKVELRAVTNSSLLDIEKVKEYISMVAPIPFDPEFPFVKKIHKFFNKNNVKIEEYDVHLNVNTEKIYKPYKANYFTKQKNRPVELLDVNFQKIQNEDHELLALVWYGISNQSNFQISETNVERGMRLRKNNIGIGSEETLSKFFSQSRQNLNYVGEVHAMNNSFIPNARRDYFNDNITVQIFEEKLQSFLPKLGTLTQESSQLHSRKKDVLDYKNSIDKFEKKLSDQKLTKREEVEHRKELRKKETKAQSALKKIEKLKAKTLENEDLGLVYESVIGDENLSITPVSRIISSQADIRPVRELSKLSGKEKEIVLKIYEILDEELSLAEAERIKKKIAEHYN